MVAARLLVALAAIMGSLAAIPEAGALPGPAVGECQTYDHGAVTALPAVVAAGDHELYAYLPGCNAVRSSSQVLHFAGNYNGPVFLVPPVITWTVVVPFVGCSIGAFVTATIAPGTGTKSETSNSITMTSGECRGTIQLKVTAGGADLWFSLMPINIRVEQPNTMFLCAATEASVNSYTPAQTCMEPQVNNLNYLCAATGGVPDVFSESATTCSAPTVNLAQSGPWTITDDADGWAVNLDPITGSIDIDADDLEASLDGIASAIQTLNRLRVQLCGSEGDVETGDCMAWDPTANVTVGNQTNNVVFPDEFTVHNCGPLNPANDSECTPVVASAGLRLGGGEDDGFSFDGLHLDGSLLLLLWLAALIWCLRRAKLFAAVAATVGIFCVLIPGPEWIGWTGVLFFVLALWLEAVARDRLPYHWFKGTGSNPRSVE